MANPDYHIKVERPTNLKAFIESMRCRGLEVRQDSHGELFIQPTRQRAVRRQH